MPKQKTPNSPEKKYPHNQKRWTYPILAALVLAVGIGTVWSLMRDAYATSDTAIGGQLLCALSEHQHTEDCYQKQLICTQEENSLHTHSDDCWHRQLVCTENEHIHTKDCYQSATTAHQPGSASEEVAAPVSPDSGNEPPSETSQTRPESPLADELPRHIPADYTDCRTTDLNASIRVSVYALPGTLPDDVSVRAELLPEESPVFVQAVERVDAAGILYDHITALDISLYNKAGDKMEPSAPVYVALETTDLTPRAADPRSVQVQHHREPVALPSPDENSDSAAPQSKIVLETVVDANKGLLQEREEASFTTIFSVDSFSTFTITFKDRPEMKIKVQCVDEWEHDILLSPEDMDIQQEHPGGDHIRLDFSSTSGNSPQLPGYQFDSKAYFMRDGHYQKRIYGLSYEGGKWFYITKSGPDWSARQEIHPQPDFYGEHPKDSIRLIYKKVHEIPVEYMSTQDKPLSSADAPNGQNPGIVRKTGRSVSTGNIDLWPKSNTYHYIGKAYVNERKGENEVTHIITRDEKVYAVTPEKKEIELTETTRLRLIYSKISTNGPPSIHLRDSTRDKGMVINLFNYNSGDSFGPHEKINEGKNLQFVLGDDRAEDYNKWTGPDGGIYTGIVDTKIGSDGYPTVQGQSLNYLFDPELCKADFDTYGGTGMIRQLHTNLDRLFWLDKDGYYRYDSMVNFATVASEGSASGTQPAYSDGANFIVYEQPALPSTPAVGDNPKFLPFNTYTEANRPTADPASNEKTKQYHFGMSIEADFVIPIGGVVPDADGHHTSMRDMIFEFNGDDDVWVFIDGNLVLDLGGIHDRYGGSINFRTGEVLTNAPPMSHSSHHQPNLYGLDDPHSMSDDALSEAREKAGFGRFSQHKFQFFYLERGRGASNCEIHFNLVPVAHGFVVGKRLANDGNAASTDHLHYQFQAEIQYPGQTKKPLSNASYTLIQWEPGDDPLSGGTPVGVGKTDRNGRLWLKPGQRADFVNVINLKNAGMAEKDRVKIYVSEIMLPDQQEPQVMAWSGKEEDPGTHMVVTDSNGKKRKLVPPMYNSPGYEFHGKKTETPLRRIASDEMILHQAVLTSRRTNEFNWIDFENDLGALSSLNITKQALHTTENRPILGVPYSMKIELWDGTQRTWIPLHEGAPYWILNPGDPIPDQNAVPQFHLPKDADGQIAVQHHQTIHLKLLPGTIYKISEILPEGDVHRYTTTYTGTVEQDTDSLIPYGDGTPQEYSGIGNTVGIKSGATHNITVTNHADTVIAPRGSFSLTKLVEGDVLPSADTKFNFALWIKDFPAEGGALTQPITATYFNTPSGISRPSEPIQFLPDAHSGEPKTDLFLYPGETVIITGLPEGYPMSVEEKLPDDQRENYDVRLQEEQQAPVNGTLLDRTAATISADHAVQVSCTNKSKLQPTATLQVTKQVYRTDRPTGAPSDSDKQREFPFALTLKAPQGFAGGAVAATVSKDGTLRDVTLHFEPRGEDYTAAVSLRHGETLTVPQLPINTDVVVQETNHDGYSVSMNDVPGDTITVPLRPTTGAPHEVLCVNMSGLELPETGGTGALPYVVPGTLLLCTSGGLLFRRKKTDGNG